MLTTIVMVIAIHLIYFCMGVGQALRLNDCPYQEKLPDKAGRHFQKVQKLGNMISVDQNALIRLCESNYKIVYATSAVLYKVGDYHKVFFQKLSPLL